MVRSSVGKWLREARSELGLSTRDLATLAGVAYPTVSRIERGHTTPRWDTVTKLATAVGFTFEGVDAQPYPMLRLGDIAEAVRRDDTTAVLWTRLRGFADQLRAHPELVGAAIGQRPARSGRDWVDNVLAGIAEVLADNAGLSRPRWTRDVAPPTEPWATPGTPRMVAKAAEETSEPFTARNLTVAASAIWREPEMVQ